jgi:HEAT repeat protein
LFRGRLTAGLFCLVLLASAQSESELTSNQRIMRIRDLGKRDAQAIPALTQFLGDPDVNIRREAVKAIVKIGTEASLSPLVTAMKDNDPEVQIRATDGVTNYYVPGYVAKGGLTGSLTKGVRQVKAFFSSRNDQVIDPDVAIRPDVARAIADEVQGGASEDARSNAARAAGILRDRVAVRALADSLHAKDSELIFESLVALQKINDPSVGPALSSPAHDLDDRVQATALETIGVLHSLPNATDARSDLTNAHNLRIRRAALECLAMLGISGDRAIFQQHLDDRDADLRAAALEGLGRIRQPEDYPAIEQAYNESGADWRVHLAAAFALVNEGKVDTSEFSPLPYLIENLDVKAHANLASAYLTELVRRDEVRRALLPLVQQANRDQKIALCSILAASQADDVMPALNTLARDADPDVAFAASRAIRIAQARKLS